jgi:hypothetical protein
MDIFISLAAFTGVLAAAVIAWPVDRQPRPADRYRIYGR